MAQHKHKVSLPYRKAALRVAPSPLNTVKFDLGIILVVGFLLLLAQERFTGSLAIQFVLLLGYGVAGMIWIVLRTRQVMKILGKGDLNRDEPE